MVSKHLREEEVNAHHSMNLVSYRMGRVQFQHNLRLDHIPWYPLFSCTKHLHLDHMNMCKGKSHQVPFSSNFQTWPFSVAAVDLSSSTSWSIDWSIDERLAWERVDPLPKQKICGFCNAESTFFAWPAAGKLGFVFSPSNLVSSYFQEFKTETNMHKCNCFRLSRWMKSWPNIIPQTLGRSPFHNLSKRSLKIKHPKKVTAWITGLWTLPLFKKTRRFTSSQNCFFSVEFAGYQVKLYNAISPPKVEIKASNI